MSSSPLTYVLVTPARNEEAFIELTLQSVVNQTIKPLRWVIVSDGSTDRTDEIVQRYAARHDWIHFMRAPDRQERHFGGKVASFTAGYACVRDIPHDVVGSLDADLSFAPNYFDFLLKKFADNPKLGLAGTPFSEYGKTYDFRFASLEHVSGACQLFRRECYAAIGGYVPVKGGGIDVIAVLSARMKGWTTRTFPEMTCEHHRPMSSAMTQSKFRANFLLGERQYRLGFHPLWQTLRAAYQLVRKPYVVAGLGLFCGYYLAMLRREQRPITRDLVAFQQRDQMRRLRQMLFRSRSSAGHGTSMNPPLPS